MKQAYIVRIYADSYQVSNGNVTCRPDQLKEEVQMMLICAKVGSAPTVQKQAFWADAIALDKTVTRVKLGH